MPIVPPEIFEQIWHSELAIAAALTFLGGVVRGFSGFGSALVIAPALSLLWGPTVGVPVAALIEFVPALQLMPRALPVANWRAVLMLGVPALVMIPLGSWLLVTLPEELVRRMIAGLVIVMAATLWTGWRYTGPHNTTITTGIGAVSGALAGTTGVGGQPVILYLMAFRDSAMVIRANLIGYFAITLIGLTVAYAVIGLIHPVTLWRIAFLVPPFAIGILIGTRLFPLASEQIFRQIAIAVLVLSSGYVLLAP